MANPEHLAVLEQGVEKWNQWRYDNPDIRPVLLDIDFSGVDLSEVILYGALLRGAKLKGAILSRANLATANLESVDLNEADLSEADLGMAHLRGTYLWGADLRRANLGQAKLSGIDLGGANLSEADLSEADFRWIGFGGAALSGATIGYTVFAYSDFNGVKGLDSVKHIGPSAIDIETLNRSGGSIPKSFLRGCGVPDQFITYFSSLVHQAIQYYSCFISYSSKDQAFAERLYADLQSKGVRCWFAPHNMKIGDRFRIRIDESIRVHEKLLLVLSENSIASDWIEKEVETAMEKERESRKPVLFPVRLDDSVNAIKSGWAADVRRTRHIGDFSKWKNQDEYGKGFERLLRDLKIESSADGEA